MATSYSLYNTVPPTDSGAPPVRGVAVSTGTANIHALYDGTSAAFPGPFTQPVAPSKLSVTFTASWNGGDVTVAGTGLNGEAITEVFADSIATVQGTKTFVTVTGATKETAAGDAGNGASIGSTPLTAYSQPWCANNRSWALQVITSGTLTGTWTLWGSNLKHPVLTSDTDWVDLSSHADFVETNPAGAATNWWVNSTLIKATWLRLKYVNTSGAGTIYAEVTAETAL